MTGNDASELERSARDGVAAALANDPAPARAAKAGCQYIAQAARTPNPREEIVAVARGIMSGVILANRSLPDAAFELLKALPSVTVMNREGSESVMTWVMTGIAAVTPVIGPESRQALARRIEEKYMGAGAVFDELCEKASKS